MKSTLRSGCGPAWLSLRGGVPLLPGSGLWPPRYQDFTSGRAKDRPAAARSSRKLAAQANALSRRRARLAPTAPSPGPGRPLTSPSLARETGTRRAAAAVAQRGGGAPLPAGMGWRQIFRSETRGAVAQSSDSYFRVAANNATSGRRFVGG